MFFVRTSLFYIIRLFAHRSRRHIILVLFVRTGCRRYRIHSHQVTTSPIRRHGSCRVFVDACRSQFRLGVHCRAQSEAIRVSCVRDRKWSII